MSNKISIFYIKEGIYQCITDAQGNTTVCIDISKSNLKSLLYYIDFENKEGNKSSECLKHSDKT
jgi:hypothetical protein